MVRVVKLGNCMFNFVIIDLIAKFVWTEIYVECLWRCDTECWLVKVEPLKFVRIGYNYVRTGLDTENDNQTPLTINNELILIDNSTTHSLIQSVVCFTESKRTSPSHPTGVQ